MPTSSTNVSTILASEDSQTNRGGFQQRLRAIGSGLHHQENSLSYLTVHHLVSLPTHCRARATFPDSTLQGTRFILRAADSDEWLIGLRGRAGVYQKQHAAWVDLRPRSIRRN